MKCKLTQISCDKGFMKLKTPGVCLTGFLIIIEIPSDINGLLKSMTRSRSAVIVMAAIAISASCSKENTKNKHSAIITRYQSKEITKGDWQ